MIMWSREVRYELFETEAGHLLGKRAFYEDGLTPNYMEMSEDLIPTYGNYLLYSERERCSKLKGNDASEKRENKKQKKIQKEKARATEFLEALGRMGLGFDSEAHVCV